MFPLLFNEPWLQIFSISFPQEIEKVLSKRSNAVIIKTMKNKRTIIKELKSALVADFGEDIKEVILFGSRSTGKAHKDSDYDVLIIVNKDYDWRHEDRIISVVYDLELKYDIFIDMKVISLKELHHTIKGIHPLYRDAMREGIYA